MKSKIIKIFSIIILLIIFFCLAFSLKSGYIEKFDNIIYNLSQTIKSPFTTELFKIITFLSSPTFIVFVLILCFIFIKDKKKRNIIFLNSILVFSLNQIIKIIVSRPRPEDIMLVTETGFSFPSAHAMFSLAFYGLFVYYTYKSDLNKKMKIFLIILLCLMIILIPITRIYLGVHYASDVVAGLCLSGAILLIYSLFQKKKA